MIRIINPNLNLPFVDIYICFVFCFLKFLIKVIIESILFVYNHVMQTTYCTIKVYDKGNLYYDCNLFTNY